MRGSRELGVGGMLVGVRARWGRLVGVSGDGVRGVGGGMVGEEGGDGWDCWYTT